MTQPTRLTSRISPTFCTILFAAVVCLLWSYWTTLAEVAWRWSSDPQYSHGYLVPAFSAYLLYRRRDQLDTGKGAPLLGLAVVLAAMAMRLAGTYFHYVYLDQLSLLPSLLGVMLLVGGMSALRWAWPAIAFLGFMIPLPHSWSLALSAPMQTFATQVSTFLLQTLGRPALAEGNVILLNDIELGIVEACSGLRMLVVFFALSTAVALLSRKPIWERLLLAASAIPIALIANVLRITSTGLVFDLIGNNFGGALFHDVAGWLMMPLGLALLGIEIWILTRLLIVPERKLFSSAHRAPREMHRLTMPRANPPRERRTPPVKPATDPVVEPASRDV